MHTQRRIANQNFLEHQEIHYASDPRNSLCGTLGTLYGLRSIQYLVDRMTWFSTRQASSSNSEGISYGGGQAGDVPSSPLPSATAFLSLSAAAAAAAAAVDSSTFLLAMHKSANKWRSTPLPWRPCAKTERGQKKQQQYRTRWYEALIDTLRRTHHASRQNS